MKIVKKNEDFITKELLESLVGKIIHATVNNLELTDATNKVETVNVWFAGMVAGYDVVTTYYDYEDNSFSTTPTIRYSLLLTDGMAYTLASDCELHEITQEEFLKLVEEYTKEQMKKDTLILPEEKKIILTGQEG